jgi:hypothetical protein
MSALDALPIYQSHKKVRAAKITGLTQHQNGLTVHLGELGNISQSLQWLGKHDPHTGGYYVVYDDDYVSFSPAKAFEDGYTLVDGAPYVEKTDVANQD